MSRTILLVDDSDVVRMTLAALLEDDGHTVIEAASLAEARAQLDASFDVAVIDLNLSDGLGNALFADIRTRHPTAAIVLLTGADTPPPGADLVVEKGADPAQLGAQIEAAIARRV